MPEDRYTSAGAAGRLTLGGLDRRKRRPDLERRGGDQPRRKFLRGEGERRERERRGKGEGGTWSYRIHFFPAQLWGDGFSQLCPDKGSHNLARGKRELAGIGGPIGEED